MGINPPIYEVEELFVERRVTPGKHVMTVEGKTVALERRTQASTGKSISLAMFEKLLRAKKQ